MYQQYTRTNIAEMRAYKKGESLKGVSFSPEDSKKMEVQKLEI